LTSIKIAIILVTTLALIGAALFLTRDHGAFLPSMDTMERSLETDRHERLLTRIAESDAVISDFTTDGCSGGLSKGWEQFTVKFPEFAAQHGDLPPWQECCITHDMQYHAGSLGALSANKSFDQRKAADVALKACVIDTGMKRLAAAEEIYGLTKAEVEDIYEIISELMYRAVRVGGMPCTTQAWRWGYGWPPCREVTD
jgi:hypothetical protein